MENIHISNNFDFGKYKFELAKKTKELKKKQQNIIVKELKYGLNIGKHDFETKVRQARKFLNDGQRVKVTVIFKGREITHPDLGRTIIQNIISILSDISKIETNTKLDGKLLTVTLSPKKKHS